MTRAFELQQWLRKNGPATLSEIKAAGFTNFGDLTRRRMIKYGSIETYTGPNPHSERRYARLVTTLYIATDKDYKPPRGAKLGEKYSVEARAVSLLLKRGYIVIAPGGQDDTR